jgi:hypothetical protein
MERFVLFSTDDVPQPPSEEQLQAALARLEAEIEARQLQLNAPLPPEDARAASRRRLTSRKLVVPRKGKGVYKVRHPTPRRFK